MSQVFQLYACCVPVKGAARSTVCDVQRRRYFFIPNGLYDILIEHEGKTLDEIKAAFDHAYDDVIDEYFEFLEAQNLGFWTDEPERFPELDMTWERPERITNAIIDVDVESTHDYAGLVDQLDDLRCKELQLRFFDPINPDAFVEVLGATSGSRLRHVEAILPARPEYTTRRLRELCDTHQRLGHLSFYGAEEDAMETIGGTQVSYRTDVVDGPSCCGQVHSDYFIADVEVFTEAQQFNTCLNRKISVDARGEIRNCPSMQQSFGNVADTSLHSALLHRDFKALWEINKDQVDVCKDCEFRYVCTDCRAYIEDPDDLYSKPSKCSYDPYTATWADDDGAPPVQR